LSQVGFKLFDNENNLFILGDRAFFILTALRLFASISDSLVHSEVPWQVQADWWLTCMCKPFFTKGKTNHVSYWCLWV